MFTTNVFLRSFNNREIALVLWFAVLVVVRSISMKSVRISLAGCTEIPLLISQKDVSVPVFDTTRIHSEAAVERALKQ